MFNIFNLTDAKTVTAVDQSTGRNFGREAGALGGTVARFSMRYVF
jgi:hypothetical protein